MGMDVFGRNPSSDKGDYFPETGAGDFPCNGCGGDYHAKTPGTGSHRPRGTLLSYPFDVENVAEFVVFLRDCGGFEIY